MDIANLCIRIKDYLVIADLHLGYELALKKKGYNVPNQTDRLINKMKKLKKRCKNLLILGDLKHTITYTKEIEERILEDFITKVKKLFKKVILVKGNHDAGLNIKGIKLVNEFTIDKLGFTHGHRTPSKELMKCDKLIISHVHPRFQTQDELGARYNSPCWIVGKYKDKEVIIMPSFNELITGMDYRELDSGPIMNKLENKEVFLKDMTKLV